MLESFGSSIEHIEDGSSLSIPMIRSWLQSCEEGHARCNTLVAGENRSISRLLVIDVESMCLVEAEEPRYFALSYVWGTAKVLMTLKENFNELKISGALERYGEKVPRLIRDVILFMQKLGERYIWVDSLCIVQDSYDTKMDLIRNMDIIYGEAVCTIIAHGSMDASASLPGVWEGTRRPCRVTTTRELGEHNTEVLICSPCHYSLNPSIYDSRGWTFQEQLLSRRRLVFGADEVFFSCHSQNAGDWCENPLTDLGNLVTKHPLVRTLNSEGSAIAVQPNLNPDLAGMANTWKTEQAILSLRKLAPDSNNAIERMKEVIYIYTSAVTHYSTRNLTYSSDILNAFSGILSTLERSYGFGSGSSVYGLLGKYFFYNFHFMAQMGNRRDGWPSWSWVGWDSQIFFLERETPEQLELKVKTGYLIDKEEVRMIGGVSLHQAKDGAEAISQPPPLLSTSDLTTQEEDGIPPNVISGLLSTSSKLPLFAFWADIAPPGVPRIRPHPIRTHFIRIWKDGYEQCGHVHESFGGRYETCRITEEEWARCRLVFLSHSPRRCVFHIYADCECKGTCNTLVVDPGADGEEGGERLYVRRVAMGEVCGNEWDNVKTTREFVVLA
ncbi:heterokaryon incompatibility protein [Nemania abortiva]|nr:heterokaryon incompatibility protein [Nemania abortiva]